MAERINLIPPVIQYVPGTGFKINHPIIFWGIIIVLVLLLIFIGYIVFIVIKNKINAGNTNNTGNTNIIPTQPATRSNAKFNLYDNQNIMSRTVGSGESNDHVKYYGITDLQECESLCGADSFCQAYTWNDSNQGVFANQCYGRDSTYIFTPEAGHFSGVRKLNT